MSLLLLLLLVLVVFLVEQGGLVEQLAAIGVSWYQQNSIYLSTAGIKALMRLAETISHIVTRVR